MPFARMAGRGFLKGLPVNTKALHFTLCVCAGGKERWRPGGGSGV